MNAAMSKPGAGFGLRIDNRYYFCRHSVTILRRN